MGSRGGSSGLSSGTVSPLVARVMFNAAKRSESLSASAPDKRDKNIEKAISSNNSNFIDSIKTEKEARRVSNYLESRRNETDRKIVKLGSPEKLQKNPKLYNEQKNIKSLLNKAHEKASSLMDKSEQGRQNVEIKHTTTTYDRARKRRMKNFDEWYGKG